MDSLVGHDVCLGPLGAARGWLAEIDIAATGEGRGAQPTRRRSSSTVGMDTDGAEVVWGRRPQALNEAGRQSIADDCPPGTGAMVVHGALSDRHRLPLQRV
jgi:hypothetical protein